MGHTVGLHIENRPALIRRLIGGEIQDVVEPEEGAILAVGEVVHILQPVHIQTEVETVRAVHPSHAVTNKEVVLYPARWPPLPEGVVDG